MKQKTPLKLIAGYVLLACVLAEAACYIVRYTKLAARFSATEQAMAARRYATNRLAADLFALGTAGEGLTIAGSDALPAYQEAARHVESSLLRLDSLLADTLQRQRLDSLKWLISCQEENTVALLLALRQEDAGKKRLQHIISDLQAGRDSIFIYPDIARQVVLGEKEYAVERPRKKFFGRLADAFRRQKADTAALRQQSVVLAEDTTRRGVDISDTLARVLTGVERDIAHSGRQQRQLLQSRSESLRATGNELSRRMAALMEEFEEAEKAWLQQAMQEEAGMRRKAATGMGGFAALAVAAAALLFVWVLRDFSHAKRYRRELEQARQRAENLLKQREQLLRAVTHNLKAPAGAIQGYLELLAPAIDGQQARLYFQNIQSSTAHLQQLITALLDYHQLEAGRASLQEADFNPRLLFEETAGSLRPAATKKGLALRCETAGGTDAICRGDASRIRQIADNLLGNALKYTAEGEISIKATRQGDTLSFTVADTGCGMDEEELRRAFEAFTRLPGSQGQEGNGLGLAIVQELVRLLGGSLRAESEKGKGSRFTVTLPAVFRNARQPEETAGQEKAAAGQARETAAPATGELSILLVDDDPLYRQLAVAAIEQAAGGKWRTRAVATPQEFFEALAQGRYDLFMTDIEMAALSGFELLEQVRRQPESASLPAIAMTAHALLPCEEFTGAGFAAVLFKPFSAADLAAAVLQAMGQGEIPQAPPPQQPAPAAGHPFAALTAFADGDAAAEAEILRQFLDETLRNEEKLQEALAARDKAAACQLAHKLLPVFTMLQSPAVPHLQGLDSRRRESTWEERDEAACRHILDALRETLGLLRRVLAP